MLHPACIERLDGWKISFKLVIWPVITAWGDIVSRVQAGAGEAIDRSIAHVDGRHESVDPHQEIEPRSDRPSLDEG